MRTDDQTLLLNTAGVALFVAWALVLSPAVRGPSTAARSQHAVTTGSVADSTPPFAINDVLGTGVIGWAPMSEDGSN